MGSPGKAFETDLFDLLHSSNVTKPRPPRLTLARSLHQYDKREAIRKAQLAAEKAERSAVAATSEASHVLLPERAPASAA